MLLHLSTGGFGMIALNMELVSGNRCEWWTTSFEGAATLLSLSALVWWTKLATVRIASDTTWVIYVAGVIVLSLFEVTEDRLRAPSW